MTGPRFWRNLSLPASKDELAGGAHTKSSGTPIPIPAASRAPTPARAPAFARVPAPGPPGNYTDEDLQKATKLALDSFIKDQ